MAEMKTVQTDVDVNAYLDNIEDEKRRQDCTALIELMKTATHEEPKMWGSSIVGFGTYHYKYESGREGSTCKVGFSSRKGNIALYGLRGTGEAETLLEKLGFTYLRKYLDEIPLWRGDHVGIGQLIEDFARYLYLPRLNNPQVLIQAISSGLGAGEKP